MIDPMDKHPEGLESMSPSELAEAMELALDGMTEETYDPEVMDAYLDALDRKAPLPVHPDAESSYQEFQAKLQEYVEQGASKPAKRPSKFRRIARAGLVAALSAVLLAGAAQAAGMDAIGTIARWTESVFSFGTIASSNDSSQTPSVNHKNPADFPEEYQELLAEFEKRGIENYTIPTYVPEGFKADVVELYINEMNCMQFLVMYVYQDEAIMFAVIEDEKHMGLYEKDDGEVWIRSTNGNDHYYFTNLDTNAVAWTIKEFEYTIWSKRPMSDLQKMVDSMYEE